MIAGQKFKAYSNFPNNGLEESPRPRTGFAMATVLMGDQKSIHMDCFPKLLIVCELIFIIKISKPKKEADEEQKNCTCSIGRYSSL